MTQHVDTPLIIYVPGLLPKPEAAIHKQALFRCLIEGVRRIDAALAEEVAASARSFDIVAWTYDFYRTHRDFELDAAAVDALIAQTEASEGDIAEAASLKRRFLRWVYQLGDLFPFLIPHLASERIELHLRDLRRYVGNRNGIAEHVREMLKMPLRAAWESHRPVLLIAHSMGSVIAYDSLWQMSREGRDELVIDLFLTMGSPLGQSYIQKRIEGHAEMGVARYPNNIRRWENLSAVGDLTAIDPFLRNDFGEMLALGLVDDIVDTEVFNYYRRGRELDVHAEYGYLVNRNTARIVAEWWCGKRPESSP